MFTELSTGLSYFLYLFGKPTSHCRRGLTDETGSHIAGQRHRSDRGSRKYKTNTTNCNLAVTNPPEDRLREPPPRVSPSPHICTLARPNRESLQAAARAPRDAHRARPAAYPQRDVLQRPPARGDDVLRGRARQPAPDAVGVGVGGGQRRAGRDPERGYGGKLFECGEPAGECWVGARVED